MDRRCYVWKEDRGGYGPDAGGIHDKSMGGEGTETDIRPGGDEWPGWLRVISVGPPLGVDPAGKMRLRIPNKQTKKKGHGKDTPYTHTNMRTHTHPVVIERIFK